MNAAVRSSRGARPRAAPKSSTAPSAAPLAFSINDSTPSAGEALARSSPKSPCHYPPLPPKDKEKQSAEDQSKKKKWADESSDAPPEVQQESVVANALKDAHRRYASFNPITDFKGRVVNIEDSYGNLPYCIYLQMQYMNRSVITKEWSLLTMRAGIKPLNHTMLRWDCTINLYMMRKESS